MSDKNVTVSVSIEEKNKVGPGLKQVEDQLGKVEDAAKDAKTAVDAVGESKGPVEGLKISVPPQEFKRPPTLPPPSRTPSQTARETAELTGAAWIAKQKELLRQDVEQIAAPKPPAQTAKETAAVAAALIPSLSGPGRGGPLTGVRPDRDRKDVTRVFVVNWPAQSTGIAANLKQDMQAASVSPRKSGFDASGFEVAKNGFRQIQFAALAAAGAASAAVAATAPATWATFAGSLQLVSGEFANMLIPAFNRASWYLQRGAAWVKSWDDATRSWVSTVAVWGGGLLLVAGVVSKLGMVLTPLITGLSGVAVAAGRVGMAMATFAVANPAIAGIIALTAGVGYMTNGFGLLGDSISRAGQRADEARERIARLQSGGNFTRNDYESIPIQMRSAIERAQPDSRGRTVDTMIASIETENRRQMALNPSRLQTEIETVLSRPRGFFEPEGLLGQRGRQNEVFDILRRNGVGESEARSRANDAVPFRWTGMSPEDVRNSARIASGIAGVTDNTAQLEALRRIRQNGIPGLFEGASARPQQSRQFSSGDQFYGDILQNVLGRGELERNLMEQQLRNDEQHFNALNLNLTQIRMELGRIAVPAPD